MEANQSNDKQAQPEVKTTGTPSPVNGLAIAALVVGIIAFLSGWVPFWAFIAGAAAVVLGIIALKKAGGSGKGMAIAGLVTGGIAAIWGFIVTLILVLALLAGTATLGVFGAALDEANQALQEHENQVQDAADAKKDFAKGETAVFNNLEVNANSVKRNFADPDGMFTPANGKEFILVNITVKNIGDEPEHVSDFDFKINEGGVATSTEYLGLDTAFQGGEMSPNASASGDLVFEVTKGASDLKLQYSTSILSIKEGEIKTLTYTLAI